MAVTVYRSTDSSAPTLSGTAGDLVNVLDKCLVAGYGSKTAAGWSKPFTGTNTAVFRMGAGNQFYLDVNDNSPGTATAQEARLRGYEAMTAVATGTGPFPTVAQLAAGIIIRKSAAASGTTRTWCVVADDRTFYLLVQPGDAANVWTGFGFGDLYSFVPGTDNYRVMIFGRHVENSSTTITTSERADMQFDIQNVLNGHYLARNHAGVGGSVQVSKMGDSTKAASSASSPLSGAMALPNPVDGAVWLAPVFFSNGTATLAVRGKLRGLFHYLHLITSFADQDTVAGAGVYSGHTFLLLKNTPNNAAYCFDITGPWDTN